MSGFRDVQGKTGVGFDQRGQTFECRSPSHRPSFDDKGHVHTRMYCLSDEQAEYQIKDRTSFRQFLGISSYEDVPDEKTIWKYRELLAKNGTFDELFNIFLLHLQDLGIKMNEGKMIDASFVVAPRQRNTKEENKKIKEGKGAELWKD